MPVLAHFINKNSISIEVSDELKKEKLKIKLFITVNMEDVDVLKNGLTYSIPKRYGENDWYFSYDESAFGKFRHFKTNSNYDHDYSFSFYKKEGLIFCNIVITGPNNMERIIELNQQSEIKGYNNN